MSTEMYIINNKSVHCFQSSGNFLALPEDHLLCYYFYWLKEKGTEYYLDNRHWKKGLPLTKGSCKGWERRVENSPPEGNPYFSDISAGSLLLALPRSAADGACRRLSETGKELTIWNKSQHTYLFSAPWRFEVVYFSEELCLSLTCPFCKPWAKSSFFPTLG